MSRLTVNQWNQIWYRGASWQGMDRAEVEQVAKDRRWGVCEVYADGFPSMYGTAPSAWIEEAENVPA